MTSARPEAAPTARALRQRWQVHLLHGRWRLWDLEAFHILVGALQVVIALLVSVLVVAMTRLDGNVAITVGFVAAIVAGLVLLRGAARSGLRAGERRVAMLASSQARQAMLAAVGEGAPVAPGAAAAFVTRSADDVGELFALALPARTTAWVVALLALVVQTLVDPWSGLITLGVLACAPVVLAVTGREAARAATEGMGRLRSLATRALELLDGAVELRALGAVARGELELAAATDREVATTKRSLRAALRTSAWLDVLTALAVGLVAMTDGLRLLGGGMPLGHALAAVLLAAEAFLPLRAAGQAFHAGEAGQAALVTLDAAATAAARRPPSGSSTAAPTTPPEVLAHALALRAAPDGPIVVDDLSFEVPPGAALVVTGPTAAGKSTLLRAIAGSPLVASGSLLVAGVAPATVEPDALVASLVLVDQRPLVVAGSIRENLELGARGAVGARLDDAIERCGLSGLLARSPRGLDEEVGEEGRLLSAGERLCLALARAYLRDPVLVLLDEPGAHLDDASLATLRRGLGEFLAARTVLETSHGRRLLDAAPTLTLAGREVAA